MFKVFFHSPLQGRICHEICKICKTFPKIRKTCFISHNRTSWLWIPSLLLWLVTFWPFHVLCSYPPHRQQQTLTSLLLWIKLLRLNLYPLNLLHLKMILQTWLKIRLHFQARPGTMTHLPTLLMPQLRAQVLLRLHNQQPTWLLQQTVHHCQLKNLELTHPRWLQSQLQQCTPQRVLSVHLIVQLSRPIHLTLPSQRHIHWTETRKVRDKLPVLVIIWLFIAHRYFTHQFLTGAFPFVSLAPRLNLSEKNITIIFGVILGVIVMSLVGFMFHKCKHNIQYLHQPLNNSEDMGKELPFNIQFVYFQH